MGQGLGTAVLERAFLVGREGVISRKQKSVIG